MIPLYSRPRSRLHPCPCARPVLVLVPVPTPVPVPGTVSFLRSSRSTIGGMGNVANLSPFGRGRHEKAPPGYMFDQPPGETSLFRGKLADNVEDHAGLSPEGAVLVTPGTESSYPPPQSLNDSSLGPDFPLGSSSSDRRQIMRAQSCWLPTDATSCLQR